MIYYVFNGPLVMLSGGHEAVEVLLTESITSEDAVPVFDEFRPEQLAQHDHLFRTWERHSLRLIHGSV